MKVQHQMRSHTCTWAARQGDLVVTLVIRDGQQQVLRPLYRQTSHVSATIKVLGKTTRAEYNTYRSRGVNAHEFHLGVLSRLCKLGPNCPRFNIMLFEQSGQDCVHAVERERHRAGEMLRYLNDVRFAFTFTLHHPRE